MLNCVEKMVPLIVDLLGTTKRWKWKKKAAFRALKEESSSTQAFYKRSLVPAR